MACLKFGRSLQPHSDDRAVEFGHLLIFTQRSSKPTATCPGRSRTAGPREADNAGSAPLPMEASDKTQLLG